MGLLKSIIPNKKSTDLTTFKIFSEGVPVKDTYEVISFSISRCVNKISSAKIVLHDGDTAKQDFEASNSNDFVPGKEIKITLGYHLDEETVFKGIVINHGVKIRHNKPSVLVVELKDKAVKMTIGRKSSIFSDSTDSDAIEDIIKLYGLGKDVESTSTSFNELVQYNACDWDFIVSRADVNGKLVYTDDGKVIVAEPVINKTPDVAAVFGTSIIEFEAEIDARYQYSNVKASSWDSTGQERVETDAKKPTALKIPEHGNLTSAELSDVIGLSDYELYHSGQLTEQELQAWADAKMLRSKLAKVRGRVKFQGYAGIKPGDSIDLGGVGDRFNGTAFVSAINHEMHQGDWKTNVEFGLCPDWFAKEAHEVVDKPVSAMIPSIEGLQIGVVTTLEEDPNSEGRIKVRIPIVSNEEDGVWARLGNLLSGESSGMYFRPDVGDEVIVGFINNDPRQPMILGALHSSGRPSPFEATDDNFEKGLVTKTGLKMTFNDDEEALSIGIETPAGNKLMMSEEDGSITIEDENGNSILMNSDGITIDSSADLNLTATGDVNIEGVNIANSASAEFTADGSSGAELSSSAIAKVSGQFVHIN